jgi:hypothetical protein
MRDIKLVKAIMIDGELVHVTWESNIPTDLKAMHGITAIDQMALMVADALTEYNLTDEEKEHLVKLIQEELQL